MKKLKKVLSLVLVLAMALSMFGVCASATDVKDYPDYDEITYTEAVGVLSGIGVLQGDEGGFRPTEGLTRAEAAKIADYLIGLQDNNVAEGTKFNDIKGHWAEEYITIAESVGLVNGNGDGTFDPEGDLTGYAWEKIVLCALGYSAEYENMLGDNWEGGVAILAKEVDLLKGLAPTYDATKAITREEAAQIAYNALKTETVTYKFNGSTHTNAQGTGELLGKIYNLAEKNTFDVYGAPTAHVYYNAKTNAEYVSFPIAADDSYGNVRGGTEMKDIVGNAKATLYVDGEETAFVPTDKVGGRGVQVGVYTLLDGSLRVVVINTYVGYAHDIVTEGKNVKASYKVKDFTFDGVAKAGEVVVYTVGNKEPEATPYTATAYRQANTAVLGTITAVSGNYGSYTDGMYVGIDGIQTFFNVNCLPSGRPMLNAIVGAYYDVYGNILYLDMDPVLETISDMRRIYILDASLYVEGSSTVDKDDITNSTYTSDLILQAHAIVWDDNAASIETINIAVVAENGKYFLLDEYGYAQREIGLPGTELLIETLLAKAEKTVIPEIGFHPEKTIGLSGVTFPVVGVTVTAGLNEFAEAYVTEDGEYVIADVYSDGIIIDDKAATVKSDVKGKTYAADDNIKATYLTYNNETGEVAVEVTNGYRALKPAGDPLNSAQGIVVAPVENKEKATEVVVLQYAQTNRDIYGIFLGVLEDNETGRVYAFGLSDGTVATLNYVGEPPRDLEIPIPGEGDGFFVIHIDADIVNLFIDYTDYAKIYPDLERMDLGTVCKITVNNASGKIEEVVPQTARYSGYVEDIMESRIFLGKHGAVNYYEKALDFARDFGKVGYLTEFDWTTAEYDDVYAEYEDNDFVYVYTAPGMAPDSEEVVFITVGHVTETYTAIYTKEADDTDNNAVIEDNVENPVLGATYEIVRNNDYARVDGRNGKSGEIVSVTKVKDPTYVTSFNTNNGRIVKKTIDENGVEQDRVVLYKDITVLEPGQPAVWYTDDLLCTHGVKYFDAANGEFTDSIEDPTHTTVIGHRIDANCDGFDVIVYVTAEA